MTILGSNPRARVNTQHPEAFAICDRCGFLYNISALRRQMAYRGNQLLWNGYLVCDPCYDIPFQLNRPMFLPPDPAPQIPSRPPFWQQEMAGSGPGAQTPRNNPIALLAEDE